MQVWTDHTGTARELNLTVGAAWRIVAHFPAVDVLGNPEQVEVLLPRPDYLLPLAVGCMVDPPCTLADCQSLGDDMDGPSYQSLLDAVRSELTGFFPEPTKSRLLEIRRLDQMETEQRLAGMRKRVYGEPTDSESAGATQSSNGPDSAESTPTDAPPANSTSCSADDITTSGTTPPA